MRGLIIRGVGGITGMGEGDVCWLPYLEDANRAGCLKEARGVGGGWGVVLLV